MDDDEQHAGTTRWAARRWAGSHWVLIMAVLLVVAGVVALGVGLRAQRQAPQPPASAAVTFTQTESTRTTPHIASSPDLAAGIATSTGPTSGNATSGSSASASSAPGGPAATRGPVLPAARPTILRIPSIGVNGSLLSLGLNADGTAQVPPQTAKAQAGWYHGSPAPGQLGPAVILGHVDSAKYGPGVFFKLGALKPGATVSITRADHRVAVFRVDRVVSYAKDDFPTFDVYGNTDHAALRLITCGGKFDFGKHSYESNIVAYASLVSSHSA